MNEFLSVDQIESRYPEQWILIENPVTDNGLRVLSGEVLWHSADRDEVYQKAIDLRPKHSAIHFTGIIPMDMEFAL